MIDLDDLLAIDDTPRGAVVTGGLACNEPALSSAELEAWEALAIDPAFRLASAVLFTSVDDQTGAETFENARELGNLMGGSAVPPTDAAVVAWQEELWRECWERHGTAIWEARNRG